MRGSGCLKSSCGARRLGVFEIRRVALQVTAPCHVSQVCVEIPRDLIRDWHGTRLKDFAFNLFRFAFTNSRNIKSVARVF